MAWNEPGKEENPSKPAHQEKDPWKRPNDEALPDLEAWLRGLGKKWARFVSGKQGPPFAGKPVSEKGLPSGGGKFSVGAVLLATFVLYVVGGIYIVDPAEQAVITRFGCYVRTESPGPHWYPLVVEQKRIVNVKEVLTNQHAALMLTKDENIVNVEIAIHYYRENPENYLFKIFQPEETLKQVTDSALRYVIGHSILDDVLTSGRSEIASKIKEQIMRNLTEYESGIQLTDVVMQPARAPDQVKSAFDDAIRAQEDEIRLSNQADSYARRIQPIAEGKAERLVQEAKAYKQEVIALAKGDVQKFKALLPEYQKAPRVTRDRLYLDTVSRIFQNTTKILLDVEGGSNVLYLPLDKWVASKTAPAANVSSSDTSADDLSPGAPSASLEETSRTSSNHRSLSQRERPFRIWTGEAS